MDVLTFFHGRRVLVTGHTGFKGAWLTLWLLERGAEVIGYSADVPTTPSLFETLGLAADVRHHTGDVRDAEHLAKVVQHERPEVVFHLAAQPLVRRSQRRPKETFDVNVGGTVNLLEAIRTAPSVRVAVLVTSDKCYANRGWVWGYRENDPLGGADPYSASKACAELVAAAYRETFFPPDEAGEHGVGLATARAGNVIGGGDWAEDRLVPDCVRALAAGGPVAIRQPHAVRPWQHVLEPLAGYLALAARLSESPRDYAGAWNFGPPAEGCRPVAELVRAVVRAWGGGRWRAAAERRPTCPEAASLRLASDKALALLPWRPQWDFAAAVARTVAWYRACADGADAGRLRELCRRQISEYEAGWGRSVRGEELVVERVNV